MPSMESYILLEGQILVAKKDLKIVMCLNLCQGHGQAVLNLTSVRVKYFIVRPLPPFSVIFFFLFVNSFLFIFCRTNGV